MAKLQKNRIYYNFIKFAKTVHAHANDIKHVEIGTEQIAMWVQQHKLNVDLMPETGLPRQNRMFGVPVTWVKYARGARIVGV